MTRLRVPLSRLLAASSVALAGGCVGLDGVERARTNRVHGCHSYVELLGAGTTQSTSDAYFSKPG